jgi:hypothetical protein
MLGYSKEELSNLVAGVNKYGLDFKVCKVKVKLSLYQAMEAHRVVRC